MAPVGAVLILLAALRGTLVGFAERPPGQRVWEHQWEWWKKDGRTLIVGEKRVFIFRRDADWRWGVLHREPGVLVWWKTAEPVFRVVRGFLEEARAGRRVVENGTVYRVTEKQEGKVRVRWKVEEARQLPVEWLREEPDRRTVIRLTDIREVPAEEWEKQWRRLMERVEVWYAQDVPRGQWREWLTRFQLEPVLRRRALRRVRRWYGEKGEEVRFLYGGAYPPAVLRFWRGQVPALWPPRRKVRRFRGSWRDWSVEVWVPFHMFHMGGIVRAAQRMLQRGDPNCRLTPYLVRGFSE